MEGSILQVGLIALMAAFVIMLYETGSSLRPVACPECGHCRARKEADRLEQERLARDYARRMNMSDDDDKGERL